MNELLAKKLFDSIKKDDLKSFDECMEEFPCGTLRFGRFPVLSLLYLFSAKKITAAYEEKFLKTNSWQELDEPQFVSVLFRKKAGKCLRLYLDEVVSPLEMLLILDKTSKLKRVYPLSRPSSAVKQRLKEIYYVKYALNVSYEGDNIVLDRRPLKKSEKRRILIAAVSSVLCIAIAVGTPFVVNAFVPFIGISDDNPSTPDNPSDGGNTDNPSDNPDNPSDDSEKKYYNVSSFEEIDFASQNVYTLTADITVPNGFYAEQLNCELNGGGKTVTVSDNNPLFGVVTGTVRDIVFSFSGDISVSENFAFVTLLNLGTIKNVTLNVSGKLTATLGEQSTDGGITVAGIAVANGPSSSIFTYGQIDSCTVNYNNFNIVGNLYANATYGGIAGTNYAYLRNCTVSGKITSDTLDIAGICVTNNYSLSSCTNRASLTQKSSSPDWNPIVAGIVTTNSYSLTSCVNYGEISAQSENTDTAHEENTDPSVSAAGIAYLNRGTLSAPIISQSINYGKISASSKDRTSYAAGICISSSGGIRECLNERGADVVSENRSDFSSYGGGISVYAYGYVYGSVNKGDVTVSSAEGNAYSGGITAYSYVEISLSLSSGNVSSSGASAYSGGILAYSSVTSSGNSVYFGTVTQCVFNGTLSSVAESESFAGGIVGFVEEKLFNEGKDSETYFGGGVTESYFTGSFSGSSSASRNGGIAAACGKNIHDSNAYSDSGGNVHNNFKDNYFVPSLDSLLAVGFVTADGTAFSSGSNVGASSVTIEVINNSETYKKILSALSSLTGNTGNSSEDTNGNGAVEV